MCFNNKIISEINSIINEGWTDGIVVRCGNCSNQLYFASGTYESDKWNYIGEDTIYDLASVSKLFTLFIVCVLIDEGKINIKKRVSDYTELRKYHNLQNLYLYELINFSYEISTKTLITDCKNSVEVDDCLTNAYLKATEPRYSDIGVMVFTNMIDAIFGYGFFREYSKKFWKKAGMYNTFWFDEIPKELFYRVQSYDNEYRMDKNGKLSLWRTPIGIVHDAKCRVVGASGHAGIFSSPKDIGTFCRNVLSYKIVEKDLIDEYVTNSMYDTYLGDKRQHFGILSYKKTKKQKTSEIPLAANDNAIAMSGYTGCYLLLDINNDKFVFIGSNRIHNRATSISSEGIMTMQVKNTKEYVYRKDILRDYLYDEIGTY